MFSLKFPPHPPPLSLQPPDSLCNAPGGAAWAGVGEVVHAGEVGGPSKRHLGPHPHLVSVATPACLAMKRNYFLCKFWAVTDF